MQDILAEGLQKLCLTANSVQIKALRLYASEVLDFNKGYNLMKAESEDDLIIRHILDSLVALPHITSLLCVKQNAVPLIADIGSGGGCPGIPLAVMLPNANFVLVERMEKRCAFLERAIKKMNLSNVRVRCAQASALEANSFDMLVLRAFHPFTEQIAHLLLSITRQGGTIVAYKARAERIQEEMRGVSKAIPSYTKIPLTVPFLEDHERNLVVIRKN